MAIEEPRYQVIAQDGAFELRDCAPYLVAETRVDAGLDDAGNIAFRRLFRYISGANAAQQKIAMTAPVIQSRGAAGEKIAMTAPVKAAANDSGFTVAFGVPAKYTLDTVPRPNDPRIRLWEIPRQRVAAWRYSGRWTAANHRDSEQKLWAALAARGMTVTGGPALARYNPPFTPSFLRRNEILIKV